MAEFWADNWEDGKSTEDIMESGNRTPNKLPPMKGGIPMERFEFSNDDESGLGIADNGSPDWPGNEGSTDEFGRTEEGGVEFILGGVPVDEDGVLICPTDGFRDNELGGVFNDVCSCFWSDFTFYKIYIYQL